MELYQLRSFLAVAETGHLTRASEQVYVSQPAVSAHIKTLEEELGAPLFKRSTRGMELTPIGKQHLKHAREILDAVNRMVSESRDAHEIIDHLDIGTVGDPGLVKLGHLLLMATNQYPKIHLNVHHKVTGNALKEVARGNLDGSFYIGDLDRKDVEGVKIKKVTYCVAAPANLEQTIIDADEHTVTSLPWILTPKISTHHQLAKKLFSRKNFSPKNIVGADNESVIASLIIAGVGISLLREDIAEEYQRAGNISVWPKARISTYLWFIYLSTRRNDPSIQALLHLIKS